MPLPCYVGWKSRQCDMDSGSADGFVYALVDEADKVFYVGASTNPIIRHQTHKRKYGGCRIIILDVAPSNSHYAIERWWISELSKRFNLLNRPPRPRGSVMASEGRATKSLSLRKTMDAPVTIDDVVAWVELEIASIGEEIAAIGPNRTGFLDKEIRKRWRVLGDHRDRLKMVRSNLRNIRTKREDFARFDLALSRVSEGVKP